jgi:hypothetical protein
LFYAVIAAFVRHQDHVALIRALSDFHDITPCTDKYQVIVALTPRGLTENEEAKTTVDAADFVRVPSASASQRRPEVTLKFRPDSSGTQLAAVNVCILSCYFNSSIHYLWCQ